MIMHFLTPLQRSILDECLKEYYRNGIGISITGVPGQYDYKTAKSLEIRGLISMKEGQEVSWDTLAYFNDQQAVDYQKIKDEAPKRRAA
jgi:hypothetical protein